MKISYGPKGHDNLAQGFLTRCCCEFCQRVPEGRHDRSLARSAWESIPENPSRRVRYDRAQLIPEVFLVQRCATFLLLKFRHSNHRSVRTPARIRPYPTGRLLWGGAVPRHFVLGYDRTVPPGHFAAGFIRRIVPLSRPLTESTSSGGVGGFLNKGPEVRSEIRCFR